MGQKLWFLLIAVVVAGLGVLLIKATVPVGRPDRSSLPIPPPPDGFLLDEVLRDMSAAEYREKAEKAEKDARYRAALDECIRQKSDKKSYYSEDAPRLECAADATEAGESVFVQRYLWAVSPAVDVSPN